MMLMGIPNLFSVFQIVCHRYKEQTTWQLVVAKWKENRGGMDWEFGISRYKLLCIGWINSKVLSYSTGNYV